MRKMTWVLVVWCGLVGGVVAYLAARTDKCVHRAASGFGQGACAFVGEVWIRDSLIVGFMGFVVLALIWFMSRPSEASAIVYWPQVPANEAATRQLDAGEPEPGWYPAPGRQMRWWDGGGWTEHVRPRERAEL